jgi:DNA-directed RNA polymerase specialized sigma24 family protein
MGGMRAAMAGDAVAYHRFLESVTPFLRTIAHRRCAQCGSEKFKAEDIVRDVLLTIHLKRGTWDPLRPIGPWISAILRYRLIDAFRRRGCRADVPIESIMGIPETRSEISGDDVSE